MTLPETAATGEDRCSARLGVARPRPLIVFVVGVSILTRLDDGIGPAAFVRSGEHVVVHVPSDEPQDFAAEGRRIGDALRAELTVPEADALVVVISEPFAEENFLLAGDAVEMTVTCQRRFDLQHA
jgi:hypothetical protein